VIRVGESPIGHEQDAPKPEARHGFAQTIERTLAEDDARPREVVEGAHRARDV
jgi:hypothetical protein